ncbi:unnamed protein product [Closterium sp. Naga37s-1]|nr:unnamed protein product [Closterium sp. Naga37s-1]
MAVSAELVTGVAVWLLLNLLVPLLVKPTSGKPPFGDPIQPLSAHLPPAPPPLPPPPLPPSPPPVHPPMRGTLSPLIPPALALAARSQEEGEGSLSYVRQSGSSPQPFRPSPLSPPCPSPQCAELSLRSSPLHWCWLHGVRRRGGFKRKRRARGGDCDSKGGGSAQSECANKGAGGGLDSSGEESRGESGGRRGGADGGEMRGSRGEAGGNDGRAQGEREQEGVTLTSGVTSSIGYIQIHTTCFNPCPERLCMYIQIHTTCFNPCLERLRLLPAKSATKRMLRAWFTWGVIAACIAFILASLVLLWDGLVASLLVPLLRYLSTSSQHLEKQQRFYPHTYTHNHSYYNHNLSTVNFSFEDSSIGRSGAASASAFHAAQQAFQEVAEAAAPTAPAEANPYPAKQASTASLHVLQPVHSKPFKKLQRQQLPLATFESTQKSPLQQREQLPLALQQRQPPLSVNMPLADLGYLFMATLISLAWHEAGHAVAAAVEGVRVQHMARWRAPPRPAAPRSTHHLPSLPSGPFLRPSAPFPISLLTTGRACECSTVACSSSPCCSPEHTSPSVPLAVQHVACFSVLALPSAPSPPPNHREGVRVQHVACFLLALLLPGAHVAFHPADFHSLPPARLLRVLSAGIWHNIVLSLLALLLLSSPLHGGPLPSFLPPDLTLPVPIFPYPLAPLPPVQLSLLALLLLSSPLQAMLFLPLYSQSPPGLKVSCASSSLQ